jgi:hypothetical protein
VVEIHQRSHASFEVGEDAKVLSLLAAGKGGPINLDNLDMKEYLMTKEMGAVATYNNIMIEMGTDVF